METKVMDCRCSHAYQDKKHGKGRRVFNLGAKLGVWVCTVCERKTEPSLKKK